MALLLKNAHVVDPSVELDGRVDVLVEDDKIAAVGENLSHEGAEVVDLSGKYLVPGLVDMHVHLRDPGLTHKEDVYSGCRAAAIRRCRLVTACSSSPSWKGLSRKSTAPRRRALWA